MQLETSGKVSAAQAGENGHMAAARRRRRWSAHTSVRQSERQLRRKHAFLPVSPSNGLWLLPTTCHIWCIPERRRNHLPY